MTFGVDRRKTSSWESFPRQLSLVKIWEFVLDFKAYKKRIRLSDRKSCCQQLPDATSVTTEITLSPRSHHVLVCLVSFALIAGSCGRSSANDEPDNFGVTKDQHKFKKCDLEAGKSYFNSDLSNRDCKQANLSGVTFIGSNLVNSSFEDADLTGVEFSNVQASGTNFSGAVLRGGTAINSAKSYFSKAQFDSADLTMFTFGNNNVLDGASFRSASMRNFEAVYGSAVGVDFSGADLTKARFQDEIMDGSKFEGSKLIDTVFSDVLMNRATFRLSTGFNTISFRGTIVCDAIGAEGEPFNVGC